MLENLVDHLVFCLHCQMQVPKQLWRFWSLVLGMLRFHRGLLGFCSKPPESQLVSAVQLHFCEALSGSTTESTHFFLHHCFQHSTLLHLFKPNLYLSEGSQWTGTTKAWFLKLLSVVRSCPHCRLLALRSACSALAPYRLPHRVGYLHPVSRDTTVSSKSFIFVVNNMILLWWLLFFLK